MSDDDRGERVITVSREAVCAALFTDGLARETTAPDDIQIEELWHIPDGMGYRMRVSSSEWKPRTEGEPCPETTVEVESVYPDE